MSHEEVLVYTRLAADLVKATPMDRCEDVEPNLNTGKVYVVCTNNTDRGADGKPGPDPVNPRVGNKNGHIVELRSPSRTTPRRPRPSPGTSSCSAATRRGRHLLRRLDRPGRPISCPDNLAFDSTGNLWVATDGAPSSIGKADGLFRVPLEGAERGHVVQFLAVPDQAETCGPVIHDRDGSVFVAVQHPGEDGTWDAQTSFFPDYVSPGTKPGRGEWRGPRPPSPR